MKRLFTITPSLFTVNIVMVVVMCLGLSSISYGQSLTFARVAAWNQQGVRFTNQDEVISVHKPAQLRAAIAAINPDVIALSEVNSRADMDQIVASPFANGFRYKVNMDNNQPVPQKIAVLFKDSPDISVTNQRAVPGSDDNNPDRLRKAWAFDVKIRNFDFLLIAVHLKSGREAPERQIRERQAAAIAAFIKHEVDTKPEKDVLVVGDYNMIPTADAVTFSTLSPGPVNNELLRFISSEIPGQPPSHITRCINETSFDGNPLDGFAISAVATQEWTGLIQLLPLHRTLPMPNKGCTRYNKRVSDHLPLVARFRVSGTDDD
jgi:endonuclease/exonuclease/phosphatase family metal-dependent hydrolase